MSDHITDRKDKLIVKHGCYRILKTDQTTGDSYYTRITNFTLTVDRCFINTDTGDISREIFLCGKESGTVGPFLCDAETALTTAKFQAFCFSKGLFFYEGGKKDLIEIWKKESQNARVFIQETPYLGYVEKFDTYLFSDMAIAPGTSARIMPENDIFKLNDTTSLTYRKFSEAAGRLPVMNVKTDLNFTDVAAMFHDSIGNRGVLTLCWVVLVALLPHITAKYNRFPHIFLSGKTQSGKTSLSVWLMAFYGIFAEGIGIGGTTVYAINEMLAYYSGLPVWVDEYRSKDPKSIEKHDFFKNAYDRQGSVKGQLGNKWREIPINGCLMITGEELPTVHSILSRCLCVELSEKSRGDRDAFDVLQASYTQFPALALDLLSRITPKSVNRFFRYQIRVERVLMESVKDNRIAFNYSLALAAYRCFIQTTAARREARNGFADTFVPWLIDYAVKDRQVKEAEKLTMQFLFSVIGLIEDGFVNDDLYLMEEGSPRKLFLAIEPIYRKWEKEIKLRGGKTTYVYKTLIRDLKDEAFYMEDESEGPDGMKRKRILGKPRRCVCLDISKLPESLRQDFENFIDAEVPQKGEAAI